MLHHSYGRAKVVSAIIALGMTATSLTRGVTLCALPTHTREVEAAYADDILETEDPCRSATPSLPLVISNAAEASAVSLDVAVEQVQEIWATAGLRLVRITPTGEMTPLRRQVPVVIRRVFGIRRTLTSSSGDLGEQLGQMGLDFQGHPAGRVEVSFEAVAAVVRNASYLGRTVKFLPPRAQEYLVGRALGRVMAHEIGHWLFGRAHARDGVMKASMTGEELIHPRTPALPGAWTAPGSERPLASSSQCGGGARAPARPLVALR